ncbi:DUF932 domain-containing protein [Janthinobacterium tructae]|uniref:DUF932 domain-containing protein n=1 Tax=Janthinobacterium tructae TaxID=2590869 RepID=A0A4Y6RD57_9BURK|nr:DUF932 domain-containing protein [Janthinobacterium tructae]QDG70255.1 DUF932 domain-containing protein [Janthinobacterium tructae]
MKTGRPLEQLVVELERQAALKKDMIVPATKLVSETTAAGQCNLVIDEPYGKKRYLMNDFACGQLAKKLDIPLLYFKRMRSFDTELLDENINAWFRINATDSYMVRTLAGRARAFLSSRFRRLDNIDLAQSILPILLKLPGARFESVELTETKMYLKVVSAEVTHEVAPGDVLQAGVVVSNSEIGVGRLRVEPLIFRLKCSNGLIACERSMRKNHAGRLLECGDDVILQDDTVEAEDRAIFLKARDMVQTAVSETTFQLISEKMRKTMGIALTGDPVKSVEVLANRFVLNETERAGVLRHLISEQQLNGYGLLNAVTGYSQEVDDYDRATEFEEIGGKMLELSGKEWQQIVEAA